MLASLNSLPPTLQMAMLVLGVLVLASIAVAALRSTQPKKDYSELTARVRAWWIMAAVFFAAIAASNRISLLFFGLLSFWAMKEYVTLLKTRPADRQIMVHPVVVVQTVKVIVESLACSGNTPVHVAEREDGLPVFSDQLCRTAFDNHADVPLIIRNRLVRRL